MEIVNFTEREMAPMQWLAICRLAALERGRLEVWGFDGLAVRAQPMPGGGVRDWIVEETGTTWRRHAAVRVERVLTVQV